ncbi:DUF2975 domain-containing protein [Chryseobacterium wangxinyae]|uniref:DUF2975 domain-containing protein n=1 Tax=Chryseobacterium sp. CY350 TaxID=2997336 RepID=UPI00227116C8|nr:DUF2975 domain-containing protein [Chryseobacterium sp. CY350]MCY0978796.1 DUF2975 domain-containing protein [Chryseobacterium sp. CY350]WBZ93824.1 DUF2975 domain-containing protein [Chryseobacterium sp. CY350]
MKSTSNLIIEILTVFIWIYTFVLCIALAALIFTLMTTLLGIDIGTMKEMKITINLGSEKITNVQALGKIKMILILAYAIISGILELLLLTFVIKILRKFKQNQYFSIEIYFLISKIAKFALVIGCISLLAVFINQLFSGSFIISMDVNNDNFKFFIFAGIVYIIAEVYKKAVDIHSENELTI